MSARQTAIIASPALLTACSPISLASPDSPAPLGAGRSSRRAVPTRARPASATARRSSRRRAAGQPPAARRRRPIRPARSSTSAQSSLRAQRCARRCPVPARNVWTELQLREPCHPPLVPPCRSTPQGLTPPAWRLWPRPRRRSRRYRKRRRAPRRPRPRTTAWSPTTSAPRAGYQGLALGGHRGPRGARKLVTVDEIVLLPGPRRVLAPEWVPWSERLRPGDLGVGRPAAHRGRRRPARAGLHRRGRGRRPEARPSRRLRARALAGPGCSRLRVATRRPNGGTTAPAGPDTPIAEARARALLRPAASSLPLAGSLGAVFGVCANEFSPGDGAVVADRLTAAARTPRSRSRQPPSGAAVVAESSTSRRPTLEHHRAPSRPPRRRGRSAIPSR